MGPNSLNGPIRAYLAHLSYNMWKPTLEECRERHMQAIELVGQAGSASS
jgi:hypothetical protein